MEVDLITEVGSLQGVKEDLAVETAPQTYKNAMTRKSNIIEAVSHDALTLDIVSVAVLNQCFEHGRRHVSVHRNKLGFMFDNTGDNLCSAISILISERNSSYHFWFN